MGESKKAKKNGGKRSGKGKEKKSSNKQRKGSRSVDGTCLEAAMTAMKRWRDVVANFDKQNSRITKQSGIASKKSDKKAVFAPIALKLVALGGGNKSALACSGSKDTDGAKQLTNLTQTLFDCEVEVNKSCHTDNFPAANTTKISECELAVETFKTETKKCVDLSKAATATDAYECWTNSNFTSVSDAVKTCKISEVSTIAKGLKSCTAAFSKCRKFEDDVVDAFSSCSKSVSDITLKAAALHKNKAALAEVKTKVAKITGSSRGRVARAAATDCASFIVLVANLVMAVDQYPSSPDIITMSADITSSADPTCSDAEKASLTTQATALDEAIATVEASLMAVQDDLTTATGTTASEAALLTAAEATTAAPAAAAPAAAEITAAAAAAPTAGAPASASATGSTAASGRFRAFRGIY